MDTVGNIFASIDKFTNPRTAIRSKNSSPVKSNSNDLSNYESAETPTSFEAGSVLSCVTDEVFLGSTSFSVEDYDAWPTDDIVIEKNEVLQSDVSITSSDIEIIKLEFSNKIIEQNNKIDELQAVITSLEADLGQSRSKIDYLHSVNVSSNNQLTSAIAAKSNLVSTVTSLQSEISSLNENNKVLESALLNAQKEMKAMSQDLESHKKMNTDLATSKKSIDDQLKVELSTKVMLDASLTLLRSELATKNHEYDTLAASSTKANSQLDEIRTNCATLNTANSDLEKKLTEKDATIKSLLHDLDLHKKMTIELDSSKLSSEYQIKALMSKEKELEARIAAQDTSIKSLSCDLESHQKLNTDLVSSKKSVEDQLKVIISTKGALESSFTSLQSELATKNLEYDTLLTSSTEANNQLDDIRKSCETLTASNNDLEIRLAEKDANIKSLSYGLESLSKMNAKFELMQIAAEDKLKVSLSTNSNLEAVINSLKLELQAKSIECDTIKGSLTNIENQLAETRGIVGAMANIESQLSISRSEYQELYTKNCKLESDLAHLDEKSKSILSEYDELKSIKAITGLFIIIIYFN